MNQEVIDKILPQDESISKYEALVCYRVLSRINEIATLRYNQGDPAAIQMMKILGDLEYKIFGYYWRGGSYDEDEETSEFKPTPECVKACHQNGKHSPHCQHNHQFDEEVISAAGRGSII